MEDLLQLTRKKRVDRLDELIKQREIWRRADQKVVFTNGCFDLLHMGHLAYLASAKRLGDILIIGLNADRSVKRLKGPTRPIKSQEERSMQLAVLTIVDAVILFEEDTPAELIAALKPDILVKGGDYSPDQVAGREEVEKTGGRVVILPFLPGYSSSKIIQKIQSL